MHSIDISVIVPTRNESKNVGPLVDRLAAVLAVGRAEVIFADDSSDDTPAAIEMAAATASVPVLLLHREPAERAGGLGGAVVAAMRMARGRVAVVMDGDLQHPPETIPDLIRPIDEGQADLVVASRYRDNGEAGGLANAARVRVSRLAVSVTRVAFPRRLRAVSDPMSGFFAVRTAAVDLDTLRPAGFKILLEAVVRCRPRVAEVGFSFAPRYSGKSKASLREGLRFASHLSRLRIGTLLTARQARAAAFATVGLTGLAVNAVAFFLIVHSAHLNYLLAAALATQVSTTWNFAGTEVFVFPGSKPGHILGRYAGFSLVNNSVMLARLPLLALLVTSAHTPQILANLITLLAVFVVRFGISDRFIYEGDKAMQASKDATGVATTTTRVGPVDIAVEGARRSPASASPSPAQPLRYHYDLHGIVRIGSDVVLPELSYFLSQAPTADHGVPDIVVRVGRVGRARKRASLIRSADDRCIRWEEHLGRGSANFAVEFGPQIAVTTSRALARSPHVLYTNVVEALLRFVFVDHGYMLLHSACIDVDGRGLMLSARTDTGKTGTVLALLRTLRGQFLSDDMTIIDSAGTARSFPKPLTISQHTLRAVHAGDLSRLEWAQLRVQSRLHSKEGRGFAMMLAEHNVAIMTINGWVQRIVPPPKYHVQRLVPCELTSTTTVERLYIIERGTPHHGIVPKAQAISELLENTEDAYGFPPYRYLAPVISVGGLGYDELREKERLILISAMESVSVHRLGSDDFSWAEQITAEVAADSSELAPIIDLRDRARDSQGALGALASESSEMWSAERLSEPGV